MNNKGVSLISLAITIIVIIILAAISIVGSTKSLEEASKVKFQNDLKAAVDALEVYNQRAYLYGVSNYDSDNLTWDGTSEKAVNTAKIEDKNHINEDSIRYIMGLNNVPDSLKDIITIEGGKIKVDKTRVPQYDWAVDMYSYMEY